MARALRPVLSPEELRTRLEAFAREAGFVAMGICAPDAIPEAPARLQAFVDAGLHGEMAWMADRMEWRANPAALWPEAKSVIMLAEAYTPAHDPRDVLAHPDRAAVSVYAHGKDYHDLVKKRLKTVGRWLLEQVPDEQIKVFVDTAPVMEKPLAQAAGLGWQGKHTNLLSRQFGNWVFLGAIFTTIDLPKDAPERSHCGSCTSCLTACPTDAFPAPYRLDPRRCVSYLTIEHKDAIPLDLRGKLGNRIYGCDDCLAACPWNKFAVTAREMRYTGIIDAPHLAELARLDDTTFRARFSGSPIKRIGRNRFLRNVLYAIGNSGDPHLRDAAVAHMNDPDPIVADAAAWAVSLLAADTPAQG